MKFYIAYVNQYSKNEFQIRIPLEKNNTRTRSAENKYVRGAILIIYFRSQYIYNRCLWYISANLAEIREKGRAKILYLFY